MTQSNSNAGGAEGWADMGNPSAKNAANESRRTRMAGQQFDGYDIVVSPSAPSEHPQEGSAAVCPSCLHISVISQQCNTAQYP